MIGKLVADYSSIAKKVVAAGHEIGNHSWSHVSAPTVSDERNVSEIDRSTDMIKSVTGVTPAWYRPPRGMLVGAAVRRAHEQGQAVAMWSVTRGPGSIGDTDADGVAKYLTDTIHPGAVIDLHDGVGASAFGGTGGYNASPRAAPGHRAPGAPVGDRGVEGDGLHVRHPLGARRARKRCPPTGGDQVPRVEAPPRAGAQRGARDLRRRRAPSTSSPARPAWPRRGAPAGATVTAVDSARYAEVLARDLRRHRAHPGAPARAGRRPRRPGRRAARGRLRDRGVLPHGALLPARQRRAHRRHPRRHRRALRRHLAGAGAADLAARGGRPGRLDDRRADGVPQVVGATGATGRWSCGRRSSPTGRRARPLRADATEAVHHLPPVDLAYLDPPYNQHRYTANYHVWETIVAWDAPAHYGVACKRVDLRDPDDRSPFNERGRMPGALRVVREAGRRRRRGGVVQRRVVGEPRRAGRDVRRRVVR